MRVLHVTGEVAPFSKTGGLGDVMGALPRAERALGVEARVLAPLYGFVERAALAEEGELEIGLGPHHFHVRLWKSEHVLLADIPGLLDRPQPYGDYPDNPLRFGALCKVASALAPGYDVLHLHDWQAALTALYLGGRVPAVQTIHNLAYQGLCGFHWADVLEIPHDQRGYSGLEFHGQLNLFKAGLTLADWLTTVSPRYAEEIRAEPGGQALSGLLQHRSDRLTGILNGIDTDLWDPSTDPALPATFDAETLDRRELNRAALLREVGLQDAGGPVFGVVSRATWQKGLDLVAEILPSSRLWNGRFVVLADGDHDLLARFRGLQRMLPDRLHVHTGFDEGLARRIYGGADFVLVPSRFEPCGLTQMFAMRYGAVPVVRLTGGLADTVRDWETGLTFFDPEPGALHHVVERAMQLHLARDEMERIRRNGLRADWSWAGPAHAYRDLYTRLVRG